VGSETKILCEKGTALPFRKASVSTRPVSDPGILKGRTDNAGEGGNVRIADRRRIGKARSKNGAERCHEISCIGATERVVQALSGLVTVGWSARRLVKSTPFFFIAANVGQARLSRYRSEVRRPRR